MPFAWQAPAIVLILATVAAIAVAFWTRSDRTSLYAYGTSYLAGDIVNTPGRRYIDQFE